MRSRPLRFVLRALVCVVLVLHLLWACAALWIDGPFSKSAGVAGSVFLVAVFLALAFALAIYIRPFARSVGFLFLLAATVSLWWLTLEPSNDRDWQANNSRLSTATIEGSQLRIKNVRRFIYGPDGAVTERWSDETYDLDELTGFDMFFSYWGPTAYGHTIASWGFTDGRHLAISIGTRKESGEEFSAIGGLFRQYELYYVVSEESDVIGVRAAPRGEQLELYRLYTPNNGDRLMLLDYMADLNDLAANPRWYNALAVNCTTTIWRHARAIGSSFPLDWRIVANGYVLELAHELGTVNNSMSVEELKRRSDITARAKALVLEGEGKGVDDKAFSAGIRENLPARPQGTSEP